MSDAVNLVCGILFERLYGNHSRLTAPILGNINTVLSLKFGLYVFDWRNTSRLD